MWVLNLDVSVLFHCILLQTIPGSLRTHRFIRGEVVFGSSPFHTSHFQMRSLRLEGDHKKGVQRLGSWWRAQLGMNEVNLFTCKTMVQPMSWDYYEAPVSNLTYKLKTDKCGA